MTFPADPLVLKSPAAGRHKFHILIDAANGQSAIRVDVSNGPITRSYSLDLANHLSYRALFRSLAREFGSRSPLEWQADSLTTNLGPELREILTENLSPKILYGYGDPAVLRVVDEAASASTFYLVCTSNDAPDSFPILRSDDLSRWLHVGFVFPEGSQPAWTETGELISDFWAPEMQQHGDHFTVFFAARRKADRELCIGVATSSRAAGPFRSQNEPLLTGNVIDPHVFVDPSGTRYLYWKKDTNDLWPTQLLDLLSNDPKFAEALFPAEEDRITTSLMLTLRPWAMTLEPIHKFQVLQTFIEAVSSQFTTFQQKLMTLGGLTNQQNLDLQRLLENMRTPFYVQQLAATGFELVGSPEKVLENDQEWEGHLIEGMWVSEIAGKYYLFYSGNDFSTDSYGIGVAVSSSPFGPFVKHDGPVITTTSKWSGPGHPSLTVAPNGELRLFMHAYRPGEAAYKAFRALVSAPINIRDDKVIVI